MNSEMKEQVQKANDTFYSIIRSHDLERMDEIWLNDSRSKCVHPGWPMVYGWEAIKESWKNIFEAGGITDIEVSGVSTDVSGKLAWVICIEKISHKIGEEIHTGYAQSTNVFEYTGSSWKMLIHHASPMPVPGAETESGHNLQ